jgi:hypothetical protein
VVYICPDGAVQTTVPAAIGVGYRSVTPPLNLRCTPSGQLQHRGYPVIVLGELLRRGPAPWACAVVNHAASFRRESVFSRRIGSAACQLPPSLDETAELARPRRRDTTSGGTQDVFGIARDETYAFAVSIWIWGFGGIGRWGCPCHSGERNSHGSCGDHGD